MLRNYFTTAIRNLLRDRTSAIINISGLTLGITGSLVLFMMVMYYASFDNFHAKRDRIYRVVNKSDGNSGEDFQAGVPSVLPDAFRNDFPEAEAVVFASYRSGSMVTIPQQQGQSKKFEEERGIVYTEPSFFNIFDREVLIGDAIKGLDEPGEAVIARKLALKYFDKEDAVGEILKFEDTEFKITAVVDDAPSNTDLPFDLMLSYVTIKKQREERGWNSIWSDEQCFVLLREGESAEKLDARMPAFYAKYIGRENRDHTAFFLQPLKDLHFDDRFDTFSYNTVTRSMLMAFSIIALFLIVTACINFINLATAEAIKRSKEVGVRKSLGSSRSQLIFQFLGETTLVTVFAVLFSIGLVQVTLLFLNPFLDLNLSLNFSSHAYVWICIGVITLAVSLLSGMYPAFIVSGFKPAQALKNQVGYKNSSGYNLRRGLVILQFCISQLFIIGTIVITNQMDYFQHKELGFSKDAILLIPIPEKEAPVSLGGGQAASASKMRTLREEALRLPGVQNASLSVTPPSSGNVSSTDFRIEGNDKPYGTQVKQIDGNYLELYDLKLVAGQNVADLDTATGYLVNEKLAHTIGYANVQELVGKNITVWGRTLPVTGVLKDFHTLSLHEPIGPTVMFNRIRGFELLSLKIDLKHTQSIIGQIKVRWEATYPEHIFTYQFFDDNIREFYEREQKMSVLLSVFTSIAIFIGCLGLFGLATFIANQKTKEIGVRKVLGASVESIIIMFSREYARLILIGFIGAAPLAWFIMNQFLSEFAYRIELGPGVFILGLGVTLTIAVLTVGYKSFRAAAANPVKSLKYE